MLDNIICQLESQAGYFVHSGVFVCDVGFVDYQNSWEEDHDGLLEMLPVLGKEVVQPPKRDDTISQHRIVLQKLHHEIRDRCYRTKHSFHVSKDIAEMLKLEVFWTFIMIHCDFEMGVANAAEH